MKCTTFFTAFLVAALCLPALAAQHNPVPGPNFAGCPDDLTAFKGHARFDITKDQDPVKHLEPGQNDFCRLMDNIYCSLSLIAHMNKTIMDFADLVQCLTMDINGPLDLDAKIPVSPNGVLDSYELAVLAYVLNNPELEIYEEVNTAWEANFWELKELVVEALKIATLKSDDGVFDKDITGIIKMMAPALTPSLVGVLAGFATLGDETTNEALGELLGLLSDIGLEPPEGGIASITTGVPELGPDGDIDGDGYTNMEEYLYFVVQLGYDLDQYLSAVFDDNQTPPSYDPDVLLSRKTGFVQIGDNVTLEGKIIYYYDVPLYIHWYKDGALIEGANAMSLELLNVQPEDAGLYSIAIGIELEDEEAVANKAQSELTASTILTVSNEALPVAGMASFGALVGALALVGIRRFRRK
ncbi:MAG: hypothetical protein GX130_14290 [Candidatus Hydrogenedens sp.]|nr:hypothetical protein [Candidatus Hydrogenedens sp.]